MGKERSAVGRRDFFRTSLGAGAGALVLGRLPNGLPLSKGLREGGPLIITSHSNQTGRNAMDEAWAMLRDGGNALDAVERGANVIEVDPEDTSVGYGGLPNERGVVQLDSSIMDGKTYNAGSVASLENIKTPASVARLVMERTDHVMLVGPGALEFAKSFGFREENLLTDKARDIWLRWREDHGRSDDWGPPDHLRMSGGEGQGDGRQEESEESEEFTYGTTNVLAVDTNGDIAGITTTSGLSWKIPGRIGDSPIIGAGLYVDNSVGAAGATGRGEDVIKSCSSFYIVMRMREGRSPQEACEDCIEMIVDRYRAIGSDYIPGEKFVAINKDGEYGLAWMGYSRTGNPKMTVANGNGIALAEGTTWYRADG